MVDYVLSITGWQVITSGQYTDATHDNWFAILSALLLVILLGLSLGKSLFTTQVSGHQHSHH